MCCDHQSLADAHPGVALTQRAGLQTTLSDQDIHTPGRAEVFFILCEYPDKSVSCSLPRMPGFIQKSLQRFSPLARHSGSLGFHLTQWALTTEGFSVILLVLAPAEVRLNKSQLVNNSNFQLER